MWGELAEIDSYLMFYAVLLSHFGMRYEIFMNKVVLQLRF